MVGRPGVDYAGLFHAIPTPYLVMTPDLVILEANPAYLTTVGRTREELVGRPVFDAFPPTPDALDDSGVPRVQLSFERRLGTPGGPTPCRSRSTTSWTRRRGSCARATGP